MKGLREFAFLFLWGSLSSSAFDVGLCGAQDIVGTPATEDAKQTRARELGEQRPKKEVIEELIGLTKDSSPHVRRDAISSLFKMGPHPEIIDAFHGLLRIEPDYAPEAFQVFLQDGDPIFQDLLSSPTGANLASYILLQRSHLYQRTGSVLGILIMDVAEINKTYFRRKDPLPLFLQMEAFEFFAPNFENGDLLAKIRRRAAELHEKDAAFETVRVDIHNRILLPRTFVEVESYLSKIEKEHPDRTDFIESLETLRDQMKTLFTRPIGDFSSLPKSVQEHLRPNANELNKARNSLDKLNALNSISIELRKILERPSSDPSALNVREHLDTLSFLKEIRQSTFVEHSRYLETQSPASLDYLTALLTSLEGEGLLSAKDAKKFSKRLGEFSPERRASFLKFVYATAFDTIRRLFEEPMLRLARLQPEDGKLLADIERRTSLLHLSRVIEQLEPKKSDTINRSVLASGDRCGILRFASTDSELRQLQTTLSDIILTRNPAGMNNFNPFGGLISESSLPEGSHAISLARSFRSPCLVESDACSKYSHLNGKPVEVIADYKSWNIKELSEDEYKRRTNVTVSQTIKALPVDSETVTILDFTKGRLAASAQTQIGAKAYHYQELFHLLGERHTQAGFAVSFAYYSNFIKANLEIQKQIETFLSDLTLQQNPVTRRLLLKRIRQAIVTAKMEPKQINEIMSKLPKERRLRIRSSSNAEDLDWFSGAGLYDSVGIDSNSSEEVEAGIKAVWASLWNEPAFIARGQAGIDHRTASMALLIHPNHKDEDANGVIHTANLKYPNSFEITVQKGKVSVTNPQSSAIPEILRINRETGDLIRVQDSNVQATPVLRKSEMRELASLVKKIHDFYQRPMELEFRVMEDRDPQTQKAIRWVMIKQARPFHE